MSIYGGYLHENLIRNKDDIYYNKEKFDSGEINLCFITGHSGSGKSTMGRNLQNNDNAEDYELDDLSVCIKDYFSMDNLKEYGDLIYSYFNGPGKKYYITREEFTFYKDKKNYIRNSITDFVHYAMKYAASHKDRKFVLEGVWLYIFFDPSEFKDYAFYIKGTSMITSKIRAARRNSQGDKKEYLKQLGKRWKYYFLDEKDITKFRNYFSKLIKEDN